MNVPDAGYSERRLPNRAYTEFGPQWKKVAMRVDRASQDCKDRWRNYVSHQDTRVSGGLCGDQIAYCHAD
jgi:hypothetical protein